jgi:NTE family protein
MTIITNSSKLSPGPSQKPDSSTKTLDLVLEGGGVKGIGLAGAVLELDKAGYRFHRVAGTSAGAIAAALIAALNAAKRPMSDIADILDTVDYQRFVAKGLVRRALGPIGDAGQLLFHLGLYDGDYLVEWLGQVLRDIGVTTFGQLALPDPGADSTLTPSQQYSLVVVTSDIARGREARLPWDFPTYGVPNIDDELIVDAVRASMSIPFFFRPVQRQVREAVIDGVTYQAGEVTWVDGGMLSNFAVDIFDRIDGRPPRWDTLGIKLSAQSSVVADNGVGNLLQEAFSCFHTMLDNADRSYLIPVRAARTVFVDNLGIGTTDFGISKEQQEQLLDSGHSAARAWLQQNATKRRRRSPSHF